MTLRYSALDLPRQPGPDRPPLPPGFQSDGPVLKHGGRRYRMLKALLAGPMAQTRNRIETDDPGLTSRENRRLHWFKLTDLLELGWVRASGGIMSIRSEGRAALHDADRRAAEGGGS